MIIMILRTVISYITVRIEFDDYNELQWFTIDHFSFTHNSEHMVTQSLNDHCQLTVINNPTSYYWIIIPATTIDR